MRAIRDRKLARKEFDQQHTSTAVHFVNQEDLAADLAMPKQYDV